ncbi:WhiB family transcriptional regulator [Streptomyces sp. NPDC048473]|uniref:WhiB family transcriptional regulator n=1 Tax=Streptomyces sp. NPDC048473 TaxID=3365556 RepID=UPI00370FA410
MKLSLNARQLAREAGPVGDMACRGVDPDLFFPEASPVSGPPSVEEREALKVCAGCPVRDWCLAREMAECTTPARIIGVRGGLRQADRRALYVQTHGRRAPYRAGAGDE